MYLNEEEIILEIDFNAVEPSGTFGTRKLGTYRGKTVAVKCFLPQSFPKKRLQRLILKEAIVYITSYNGINKSSTTVSFVLHNLKKISITKDDWFIFSRA